MPSNEKYGQEGGLVGTLPPGLGVGDMANWGPLTEILAQLQAEKGRKCK